LISLVEVINTTCFLLKKKIVHVRLNQVKFEEIQDLPNQVNKRKLAKFKEDKDVAKGEAKDKVEGEGEVEDEENEEKDKVGDEEINNMKPWTTSI
jgi:hypothetical protein